MGTPLIKLKSIQAPQKTEWVVEKAILKVICGQMLSRKAAITIFDRLMDKSKGNPFQCMELPDEALRKCGLSNQKLKTLKAVRDRSKAEGDLSHWSLLSYEELNKEVKSVWGLSQWSSDMLAIFYFGHPDVYPVGDGTLKKATDILNLKYFQNNEFDPQKASPNKTLLSLSMWKLYDEGLI